ncbi:MAG: pilus assembly PilX N-terminal domain-containing protein [Pseudomonas sp.]|uniref:pilus assembly PilX family protein n=1 Tax=Pseudomonas sp. TaxID=306 RepID=UPI00271D595C|nr:pilus assembly PilX N-terminal domain-containing protein [Pseudomonas sp.]MDO9617655.1 pilus assembly PilX N-terminal domain-containing protein [Pseudomonas sp.]MDP2445821.1 pilus assembly PilX N-terminal domain-containing protein [Pseudomonas sp.]MDZ4335385.1 pilus assembly PilX N-terminal domain-containing protein [Pseudomonas sp.]
MNTHKQRGVVLLVSLLLLLMLTLIAITAANQSSLQLRISSNSEQQNAAFQAAESGLQQWANAYFSAANNATFPAASTAVQVGASNERFSVATIYAGPCAGGGLGRVSLNCFDIQSTGEICESGSCNATAVHRQGGQRRQLQ